MASRSAPVVVSGSVVATVETAATFRNILVETGIVAVCSSLLGLAIFFVVRTLPARIIDRRRHRDDEKVCLLQRRLVGGQHQIGIGQLRGIHFARAVPARWDGTGIRSDPSVRRRFESEPFPRRARAG